MASRKRKTPKRLRTRKLSVMVIHRIEDMMELASAVKTFRQPMVAALGDRYSASLLEGETLPDYELALDLAVRDAKAALDHLVQLDDRVDDAAGDLDHLRFCRDQMVREELYPRAVAVRSAIDLAFGKQRGGWIHGLRGRTRRKPTGLGRQVKRMLTQLTHPGRELPPPNNPHAFVDREGWTRQLQPLHQKLVKLERNISRRGAELTSLVFHRKRALKTFDTAYGDSLRLVTAAFAMAGFDSRAIKYLKPYYQRRRLSKQAKKKRETRAAQASEAAAAETEATETSVVKFPGDIQPARETRATLSKTVAKWLEKRRLFGA